MTNQELANKIFSSVNETINDLEKKYPPRNLPAGAEVTRFAPSPTGFLHIGSLYTSLIDFKVTRQSSGVFFLRVEDTDQERSIEGAMEKMIKALNTFGIKPDEGLTEDGTEVGNYGPYKQSERIHLYHVFAKDLVSRGLAYLCFMTKEELTELRTKQEESKIRPGYYGEYAEWRFKSLEEVEEALNQKKEYVIRLKSTGDCNKKHKMEDMFLGEVEVPENDEDFVLLKSDGVPTYHFAHIVDDFLMRTTFVIRGEEWFASLGKHLELWNCFNLKPLVYGHVMPINKQDGSTVRKLSKRKDLEADVEFYLKEGYLPEVVIGYLLRLANPTFDEWMVANKGKSFWDFPFSIKELRRGGRGPLIDMNKLHDISSNYIASMSLDNLINGYSVWAKINDSEFAELCLKNKDYFSNMMNIERDTENPRKDIVKWSDVKPYFSYFFDELFDVNSTVEYVKKEVGEQVNLPEVLSNISNLLKEADIWNIKVLDDWVVKMKSLAKQAGFSITKEEPMPNGNFGSFMKIIRVALTGRDKIPNLFYVLDCLGRERVLARLENISKKLG